MLDDMTDRFTETISPMNAEAQAVLESIVAKDVDSLTPGERNFLKARAMYLTGSEQIKFADVLLRSDNSQVEEVQKEETDGVVESPDEESSEKISYRDLQKLAASKGIKAVGVGYDKLLRLVQEKVSQE